MDIIIGDLAEMLLVARVATRPIVCGIEVE